MAVTTWASISLTQALLDKWRISTQQPNALAVLMQNAGRLVLPSAAVKVSASSEQQLRGDQRLRNNFLRYLQESKVGWSPSVSTTGEQFVETLTCALWYLDPHHQQLADRWVDCTLKCSTHSLTNTFLSLQVHPPSFCICQIWGLQRLEEEKDQEASIVMWRATAAWE